MTSSLADIGLFFATTLEPMGNINPAVMAMMLIRNSHTLREVYIPEKVLVDCDAEFKQFVEVMDCLGEKLGPLVFQVGYFNKNAFLAVNNFFHTNLLLQ